MKSTSACTLKRNYLNGSQLQSVNKKNIFYYQTDISGFYYINFRVQSLKVIFINKKTYFFI